MYKMLLYIRHNLNKYEYLDKHIYLELQNCQQFYCWLKLQNYFLNIETV